jgi:hypothetical protein
MRRLVRFGANLKLGLPQLYICFGELRTLTVRVVRKSHLKGERVELCAAH